MAQLLVGLVVVAALLCAPFAIATTVPPDNPTAWQQGFHGLRMNQITTQQGTNPNTRLTELPIYQLPPEAYFNLEPRTSKMPLVPLKQATDDAGQLTNQPPTNNFGSKFLQLRETRLRRGMRDPPGVWNGHLGAPMYMLPNSHAAQHFAFSPKAREQSPIERPRVQSGFELLTTSRGFPYMFHNTAESIAQVVGTPSPEEQRERHAAAVEARQKQAGKALLETSATPAGADAGDQETNKALYMLPSVAYPYAAVGNGRYNPFNAGHTGWAPVPVPVPVPVMGYVVQNRGWYHVTPSTGPSTWGMPINHPAPWPNQLTDPAPPSAPPHPPSKEGSSSTGDNSALGSQDPQQGEVQGPGQHSFHLDACQGCEFDNGQGSFLQLQQREQPPLGPTYILTPLSPYVARGETDPSKFQTKPPAPSPFPVQPATTEITGQAVDGLPGQQTSGMQHE